MAKSTEVAIIEDPKSAFPILSDDAGRAREAVEANLGGAAINTFELDRITVPAGGGNQWAVPTLEGEDHMPTIEGIIIQWQSPRAYFEKAIEDTGGGEPPDCASPDGVYGEGIMGPGSDANPSGECSQCPFNAWGSSPKGKGKACGERKALYMMRPGGFLPIVVFLPATSIKLVRQYLVRLASQGVPYWSVITSLALEPKSEGALRWSLVLPTLVQRLNDDDAAAARKYGLGFEKQLPRSSGAVADAD